MATRYITTNILGAGGTGSSIGLVEFGRDFQSIVIMPGVYVASEDGKAITNTGNYRATELIVHGTVFSNETMIFNGNSMTIEIAATGIVSSASVGIFVTGSSFEFVNAGRLSGNDIGARFSLNGYGSNSGQIIGGSGIFLQGASDFVNSGEIEGTLGTGIGVYHPSNIQNIAGGSITGLGSGIIFANGSQGSVLRNSGLISTSSTVDFMAPEIPVVGAVNLSGLQAVGAQVKVYNWGVIEGGYAYLGSANSDFLLNRGEIRGLMLMNAGNDHTDNRLGTIVGDWLGGAGNDTYYGTLDTHVSGGIFGEAGNDTLRGGLNADRLFGGADADLIYGYEGDDSIDGGDQNDRLSGDAGDDTVTGGTGLDTLLGGAGDDSLLGGTDSDGLSGGDGNDTVTGNGGGDTLAGGAGADVFVFLTGSDSSATNSANRDRISDFVRGTDKIDLFEVDANSIAAANQSFTFIGAAAFSRVAGQLRYDALNGLVQGDANGNGVADFAIVLSTRPPVLSAADFIL